jgi:chemotaxis protein MotB
MVMARAVSPYYTGQRGAPTRDFHLRIGYVRRGSYAMNRAFLLSIVCSVVISGCVSQGKYDGLKKQYDDAQAQLLERDDKLKSLEQTLAGEQQKSTELSQAMAEAKDRLAQLDAAVIEKDREIASIGTDNKHLTTELANLVKDRARLKESADQLRMALDELSKRKAEAEKRLAEFRNLLSKFKGMIDAGQLQVKIVDGRMVLALPTDVLFSSGSADLSTEGKAAIQQIAGILATIEDRKFQVEGHTDNVPIKTARFPSNWELASARSTVVVKTMVEGGMHGETLSAASFGEFRPVAANDSDANKAKNRRIEIVLVPDLSSLPGFDELQRATSK